MHKPNRTRTKMLIIFLVLKILFDILSIISDYLWLLLLRTEQKGGFVTFQEYSDNFNRKISVFWLSGIVSIAIMVFFILWFKRGYYNLGLKTNGLKYAVRWATWSWFVPIMNLFRPVQIMTEMSTKTHDLLLRNKVTEPSNRLKWIIPTWWILWLLKNLTGIVNFQKMFTYSHHIEGVFSYISIHILSSFVSIPLTIITLIMVWNYSKLDELLPLVGEEKEKRDLKSDEYDLLDTI